MRWLLIGVLALAAIGAIAALIGTRLPRDHIASRQATLPAPPDAVWRAITNIEEFPSWRPDIKTVERLAPRDGRVVWTENGGSGRMTLATERSEPPRQLVVRIEPGLPFGGTWTYEVAPAAGGSTLTITENGEIYNPLFRFMARYIFGYEGTIETYLAALQKHLGAATE